jgi:hypothetical protein
MIGSVPRKVKGAFRILSAGWGRRDNRRETGDY